MAGKWHTAPGKSFQGIKALTDSPEECAGITIIGSAIAGAGFGALVSSPSGPAALIGGALGAITGGFAAVAGCLSDNDRVLSDIKIGEAPAHGLHNVNVAQAPDKGPEIG